MSKRQWTASRRFLWKCMPLVSASAEKDRHVGPPVWCRRSGPGVMQEGKRLIARGERVNGASL